MKLNMTIVNTQNAALLSQLATARACYRDALSKLEAIEQTCQSVGVNTTGEDEEPDTELRFMLETFWDCTPFSTRHSLKVPLIKMAGILSGCGLKEAKDWVEKRFQERLDAAYKEKQHQDDVHARWEAANNPRSLGDILRNHID